MLWMNVVGDEEWSQPIRVLGMDKTSSDILDESSEWSAAVITASGFFINRRSKKAGVEVFGSRWTSLSKFR